MNEKITKIFVPILIAVGVAIDVMLFLMYISIDFYSLRKLGFLFRYLNPILVV